MLDTDTDWSETLARQAKSSKIIALESKPQLEAMLLRLIGQRDGGDSQTLKERLAPFVDHNPLSPESYADQFHPACLQAAHKTEPTIDCLLQLMKV